jgi:hypothetical protein
MGKIVTVDFHNDTLFAVERDDGVFIAIKPICDTLGLAWQKQLERLKRDTILAEGITMTVIPSIGGPQETTLLRLDLVNGWLFGIDETRVKDEETRQKVLTYKRECYASLFRRFYKSAAERRQIDSSDEADPDEPLQTRKSLVTEARHSFGSQASRELWFKLNLPTTPSMISHRKLDDLFTYAAARGTEVV